MGFQFRLSRLPLAITMALSMGVHAAEDTVVVTGLTGESAVGPDFNYLGQKSLTATKTELAINETPKAVSVVTREQMDDRASVSISDALQYTPSIQANYYGEDNKQDWFVIRGFQQAGAGLYQDGTRLYSAGFYSWQIDPFALERVEILRGPASSLYGQNPPGGLINTVSKRPQFDGGSGQLSVEFGSHDRVQVSGDVNLELSDDVALRLVMLDRKNGTRVDGVEAERTLLAPSLSWNISDATNLTVLTSYQKDDSDPYLQFLPMEGTLTANPNGKISDSLAIGDPDWERFEREQLSLGYQFEHHFNDAIQFGQSVRYSKMEVDLRQIYALNYAMDTPQVGPVLDPTSSRQTVLRGVSTEEGTSKAFNMDNRFVFHFTTGAVEHTLLTGLDYQMIDIDSLDFAADPLVADGNNPIALLGNLPNPAFNVFDATYSNNLILLDSTTFQPLSDADRQKSRIENRQLGLYVQNHMRIAQDFIVQAGLRYDDTLNQQKNLVTGKSIKADYQAWTAGLGLAYNSVQGLTPYFNYAQSFEPVVKTSVANQAAKPERGEVFELGIKYQPSGFDGYFNAALYNTTKQDVIATDVPNNSVTQIGEIENRGIELEAVANVTSSLTLLANLALVDSEIVSDSNKAIEGKRPAQVADTLGSVWANYRFIGGPLDGFHIGGGARYTGETFGDNYEKNKVDAHTLFDLTMSYRFADYKFQVAAKNVFDKEYIATCNYYCFYGDRRNVMASISYDW